MTNRLAITTAAAGGLCWTVKAAVITAGDSSFDPLESVFFLGGLFFLLAASVLTALVLTERRHVLTRTAAAIGMVGVTLAVTTVGQSLVGAIASGDNLGLEEEGGIMLAGLAWLALAARLAATRAASAGPALAR